MSRILINQLVAAGLSLGAVSLPAQADNLTSSFTTFPQAWSHPALEQLKLTSLGAKSIAFSNPFVGTVSVTYTAECQLNGIRSSQVNIGVLIDGVLIQPSGLFAAFCSGQGLGVTTGHARHSITVAKVLASGAHSVSVHGQVVGGGGSAFIDDSTILIER